MTIEPFTIALTQSVLACLAPNAVLLWKYQLATSQSMVVSDIGSKRRERTFHIDENPKFQVDNDRDVRFKQKHRYYICRIENRKLICVFLICSYLARI